VASAFEFGDGMVQSAIPACIEWSPQAEVQREYSASYVYDKPGTYQASFSLGDTRSAPLTVVVRGREEPTTDAEPGPAQTVGEPEGSASDQSDRPTRRVCLGPMGLVLLPLAGVALASRRGR